MPSTARGPFLNSRTRSSATMLLSCAEATSAGYMATSAAPFTVSTRSRDTKKPGSDPGFSAPGKKATAGLVEVAAQDRRDRAQRNLRLRERRLTGRHTLQQQSRHEKDTCRA